MSLADWIRRSQFSGRRRQVPPGDREIFHAVFVGGANMLARTRPFVDYLTDHYGEYRQQQS